MSKTTLPKSVPAIPAFLEKLWRMVNDPSSDQLICWDSQGTSFVIQNQFGFWYQLLPHYYKHNNMSSFVRQLNMYGFHKMASVDNGSMNEIHFSHPYFLKDHPELLVNIKRKVAPSRITVVTGVEENKPTHMDRHQLTKLLNDVKMLRGRQVSVDTQLNAMKQENALLWREVAMLRQKHIKQQKIVNKLIQFLLSLVHPARMPVANKRALPLMINETAHDDITKILQNKKRKVTNMDCTLQELNALGIHIEPDSAPGPTIHEVDSDVDITSDRELETDDSIQCVVNSCDYEVTSPNGSVALESNDNNHLTIHWNEPNTTVVDQSSESVTLPETSNGISPLIQLPLLPKDLPKSTNVVSQSTEDPNHRIKQICQIKKSHPNKFLKNIHKDRKHRRKYIIRMPNNVESLSNTNKKVVLLQDCQDNSTVSTKNISTNSTKTEQTEPPEQLQTEFPISDVQTATEDPLDMPILISSDTIKCDPQDDVSQECVTKDMNTNNTISSLSLPSTSAVFPEDLNCYIENTQNELFQYKDILNAYNSIVDANALLSLFEDDSLNINDKYTDESLSPSNRDPMFSSAEIKPYIQPLNFEELFSDEFNSENNAEGSDTDTTIDFPLSVLNTPNPNLDKA